jgi:hypothetical protein
MKRVVCQLTICYLIAQESQAKFTRYIVRFNNKGATTFTIANPSPYLSLRAISRRQRYDIAIDSTDLPVPTTYVNQVRNIPNVTILNVSRWLNAVDIQTSDPSAIAAINALPFVQNTAPIAARIRNSSGKYDEEEDDITTLDEYSRISGTQGDYFNYGTASFNEIHLHNGEFLHNIGLRGEGVHIAVLDGGFFSYNTLRAFDSARINGQILSTWDFVNREASVTEDHSHGMMCLSTIAANIPGVFTGKAPKASFHLFRTEDVASEYPIEEFNWVCGAERADSAGTDVISSSLGYADAMSNSAFDHTYAQMDGNTTICTIGADLAAKKGIIVFNAAGNEGSGSWHYIIAPADGDSVVAVGAVTSSGNVGNFSSYGPASDGRIKPDVASVGVSAVVQNTNNTIGTNNGTSFACPNMAGLGSCLWQGFPEVSNMRIIRALKEAGNISTNPNNRIGYGIPDMKVAFTALLSEYATASASVSPCTVTLTWNSKDVSAMKYQVEKKEAGETSFTKIADVNAHPGSILSVSNYQYNVSLTSAPAGPVSYRIRQIIDTAAATFSAFYIDTLTPAAVCVPPNVGDMFKVAPNLVDGNSTLIVQTNDAIPNMPITVHDMEGRLVLRMNQSKTAGRVYIDLRVAGLAAGKYIVTIYNNQRPVGTTEFLKLR